MVVIIDFVGFVSLLSVFNWLNLNLILGDLSKFKRQFSVPLNKRLSGLPFLFISEIEFQQIAFFSTLDYNMECILSPIGITNLLYCEVPL